MRSRARGSELTDDPANQLGKNDNQYARHHRLESLLALGPRDRAPTFGASGNSPNSALFAAAEHLGMCLSFHPPAYVADTVQAYTQAASDHGWQPTPDQLVYRNFALVADTDARANELEVNFLAPGARWLLRGPTPASGPDHRRRTVHESAADAVCRQP